MHISRLGIFFIFSALSGVRLMPNFGSISHSKPSEALVFLSADCIGNISLISVAISSASTTSKALACTFGTKEASLNGCQVDQVLTKFGSMMLKECCSQHLGKEQAAFETGFH